MSPGDVATTEHRLRERLDAMLPSGDLLVGGVAVFDEVERAGRLEHPADLGQSGVHVGDGAQGPGGQHCVEGLRGQLEALSVETGELDGCGRRHEPGSAIFQHDVDGSTANTFVTPSG